MTTETPQDKIKRYIDDAIALESASITALNDMATDAVTGDERALYQEHATVSESQKERLEARLMALGGESARHVLKDVLNSIGAAATDLLHASKNDEDKATRNLLQSYAMENLEIAVYEALHAAAESARDSETAMLAREIQSEEKEAARRIFEHINISSVRAVNAE
jgi:ferritin-like metal-binding protein YciE